MNGLFLALEGIDGAGKSSQMDKLATYFRRDGRTVTAIHFPRMDEKPYGPMVAAFLRGEYGTGVDPHLAALLYALDRKQAAADIRERLQRGEVVIADRYVHSNIAYQCAKVADAGERGRLAGWIEELEYKHHGIPRPDLALFLDAPLDFALGNLAGERIGGDRKYLGGKEDIHEADKGLQERVRLEFLRFAERHQRDLAVVNCSDADGDMASASVIGSRILDALRYFGVASK